ncbi:MAG: hypothetical protein LBU89_04135 [Fibromonadaceae bacterium]|nr:hypothetical protein [Fibromonadaceae bacterium]
MNRLKHSNINGSSFFLFLILAASLSFAGSPSTDRQKNPLFEWISPIV